MTKLILLILSFCSASYSFAQEAIPKFTTSNFSSDLILKSDFETDFDYCAEGKIVFYDSGTGEKLLERYYHGGKLDNFRINMFKVSPKGKQISFNIFLENCSDEYVRIITSKGYETITTDVENGFSKLTMDNMITIDLAPEVISYHDDIMEGRKKDEAKKQAEHDMMERNKNQLISSGEVAYVCNCKSTCEVIVREVTGTQVNVEFIEKCNATRPPRLSSVYYINPGNQRWVDKQFLHKEKVNCYTLKSAF